MESKNPQTSDTTQLKVDVKTKKVKSNVTVLVLMTILGLVFGFAIAFSIVYMVQPGLITKEVIKNITVNVPTEKSKDTRDDTWIDSSKLGLKTFVIKVIPFTNTNGNKMEVIFYPSSANRDLYSVALKDVANSKAKVLLSTKKSFSVDDFKYDIRVMVEISPESNYLFIHNDGTAESAPSVYIFDENGTSVSNGLTGAKMHMYASKNAPKELGMNVLHLKGWISSSSYLYSITDGETTYEYILDVPSLEMTIVE